MPTQTIVETRELLASKQLSPVELVDESLATIKAKNSQLNALLEVLGEEARVAAQGTDVTKPLGGIPIAVKDVICTVEGHTTAGSKILANFRSPYDATVIKKLKAVGAIIIAKANLDEFAMGASTEYSAFGVVKNPWDTTRVVGGSSGGSAAAVAAGLVPAALGTETGGSIRLPSSFCNVVGVKATYGRVSRFGVLAYGSSLDQVGPSTRTVKDAALLMEVLAGHDPLDATSSQHEVPRYTDYCGKSIKGLKIGVPKEFFAAGVQPEVAQTIRAAIAELEKLGATTQEVSLSLTPAGIAVYYLIAKAEASTNLARYDGLRFGSLEADQHATDLLDHYLSHRGAGFGPEVKRAILMGSHVLSSGYYDAWYKQASKVRTLIRREFEDVFKDVGILACPVSPEPAFKIGSKSNDPLAMYLADALTVPVNIAGVPAISVPAGFSEDGLPIGLQLIAPHFEEARLFQVGYAYEQSQEWWQKVPSLQRTQERYTGHGGGLGKMK